MIKKIKQLTAQNSGFTVIELIVAVLIFSVMITAVLAIFGQAIKLDRKATSAQKIEENALFILESMSKEIRVSTVNTANSNCTATSLSITHPINGNVTYTLSGGQVTRTAGSTKIISSSDVIFNSLKFCITGNGSPSDDQPTKVTILAEITSSVNANLLVVDLETSVVSRDLTSEFVN